MAEEMRSESLESSVVAAPRGMMGKARTTLEMIKFEHSVFALPFALTGAMLAVRPLMVSRDRQTRRTAS